MEEFMSKNLASVTNALATAFERTCNTVVTQATRTTITGVNFQNGLKIGLVIQVPNFDTKLYYQEILNVMVNYCGIPIKWAAQFCGLSYSYATRLLRQR